MLEKVQCPEEAQGEMWAPAPGPLAPRSPWALPPRDACALEGPRLEAARGVPAGWARGDTGVPAISTPSQARCVGRPSPHTAATLRVPSGFPTPGAMEGLLASV